MCVHLIGEETFKQQVKRYSTKFARCKTNKRALKKITTRIRFLQRYGGEFGVRITFNPDKYKKLFKIVSFNRKEVQKQIKIFVKEQKKEEFQPFSDSDSEDSDEESDEEEEEEETKQFFIPYPAKYYSKINAKAA